MPVDVNAPWYQRTILSPTPSIEVRAWTQEREIQRERGQRCAGLGQALRTAGAPGAGDRRSTARARSGGRNPEASPSYRRAVDEVRSALLLDFRRWVP